MFCGSNTTIANGYYNEDTFFVACLELGTCHAMGPNKSTREEAIEAWNSAISAKEDQ